MGGPNLVLKYLSEVAAAVVGRGEMCEVKSGQSDWRIKLVTRGVFEYESVKEWVACAYSFNISILGNYERDFTKPVMYVISIFLDFVCPLSNTDAK